MEEERKGVGRRELRRERGVRRKKGLTSRPHAAERWRRGKERTGAGPRLRDSEGESSAGPEADDGGPQVRVREGKGGELGPGKGDGPPF